MDTLLAMRSFRLQIHVLSFFYMVEEEMAHTNHRVVKEAILNDEGDDDDEAKPQNLIHTNSKHPWVQPHNLLDHVHHHLFRLLSAFMVLAVVSVLLR